MVETKSMKVSTSSEQSTIDEMACFGWELKSSQEINVKESHLEGEYSVTTSEKYVKLVFSRDNNMPNYQELVKLENTYYSIANHRPDPMSIKTAAILLLLAIFPGVLYIMNKSKQKKEWENKWLNEALPAKDKAKSLLS